MRVLVACEFSGVVRDAFRARGHDAWSCDLLPCDSDPQWHFQQDVLELLDQKWDLMIAHPPCTFLNVAAAWAFGDGPYHQKVKPGTLVGAARREAREEALNFVRTLLDAKIPRIALENPVGCISSRIRKPDQTIHPYQFGHDASKRTCLWLKGLSPLIAISTDRAHPRMVCGCGHIWKDEREDKYGCANCEGEHQAKPRWSNQTDTGQNRLSPSEDRWALRSLTYPGIAKAMAAAWG